MTVRMMMMMSMVMPMPTMFTIIIALISLPPAFLPLLPLPEPLLDPTLPDLLLHHRLIRGLLALLHLEQRIRADLIHRVPRDLGTALLCLPLLRHPIDHLIHALLELLALLVLLEQDGIDPALAEEVGLHLLGGAGGAASGARGRLVHPFDALRTGSFTGRFLEALELLDLALLLALAAELLDALALLEGSLLLGPHALLVPDQRGVP